MLHSVSGMRGFTIHATDGDIGSVDEFLVRRRAMDRLGVTLVADTGGRLTGRLVLVSPIAFRSTDWDRETFDVALTRQQVEQSPSIATDQPASRQQEQETRATTATRITGTGWACGCPGMYPRMAYLSAVDSIYNEGDRGTAHAERTLTCTAHAR